MTGKRCSLDGLPPLEWPSDARDVAVALGRIGAFDACLRPAERAAAAGMGPARRAAYASGRRVAHAALAMLGEASAPVTSRGRLPRWPPAFVGSIAHSDALAVAVAARGDQVQGVGVDVETEGRVGVRTANRVLVEAELERLSPAHWTLAFSAKEAVYKAVNPIVGEYLGLTDVAIETAGQTFSAATAAPCASTPLVAAGRGYFRRVYRHWLTVFVCRHGTSEKPV